MSPGSAKALIDAGYIVHVEQSPDRIYKIDEYEAVGAKIVPSGSWVDAPEDAIILGLKELDSDTGMPAHDGEHRGDAAGDAEAQVPSDRR